ncbi:MAG: SpoIIE family protein phosphatase [Candidatus Eisenbacteria bacterium]
MGFQITVTVEGLRKSWPLDGELYRVGRSSRCDIQIADPTVSKEHAELAFDLNGWTLRDLGSRNGTRLNGTDVHDTVKLRPGDMVEFGQIQSRFELEAKTDATRFSESTGLGSAVRKGAKDIIHKAASRSSESSRLVALLAEAGQMLVLPRPLRETCEEVLRVVERAVPARRLVILLRDKPGEEPQQIAVRHLGVPTREPLALSSTILRTVLDECESVVTKDASEDPRFSAHESIMTQAIRSAMAVPLFDNEKVLGVLYADTTDLRVEYNEDHLEVFTVLANMAAVKISNARLLESEAHRQRMAQELATATRIQRSLLPPAPPLPGWQLAARIETCFEVGGDLYDFFPRSDGRWVIVVGDVSGKGMGAALLMSSTVTSARVLYNATTDPAELVTRLNDVLFRSTEAGRFVTLFVGCLDPQTGELHYCNAGHNAPYVIGPGGKRELEATGIPVAMMESFPFTAAHTTLAPGETLALYSDGIPEAMCGEDFFGDDRLADVLAKASAAPDLDAATRDVITAVDAFAAGTPRADDITLVMVRRA